jgi:hypothetical protein
LLQRNELSCPLAEGSIIGQIDIVVGSLGFGHVQERGYLVQPLWPMDA